MTRAQPPGRHCAWCLTQTATRRLTARAPTGTNRYRAALTCDAHLQQARTWVSGCGPPTEHQIAPTQDNALF